MGIDGMSMGQIKSNREVPSNHHAFEADTIASMKKGDLVIGVDQAGKSSQVDRKEDNYGEDVENPIPGGKTDSNQENEEPENDDEQNEDLFQDEHPQKYRLKVNNDTNLIELYDNETNEIVDIISEENFMEIAQKLNYASGLIITEEI